MRNLYVILNPVAGNSQPDLLREMLQRRFSSVEQRYELYETREDDRLVDIVHRALEQGFDLVVAGGGDGTVSGVADGLAHQDVPLGILPVGTGNALAHDLGIPMEPEAALDLLLGEHSVRRIDALKIDDRFFVLNASVGISAEIMQDTTSDVKRRFGRLAYLWNALLKLFGLERYPFTLTIDGQDTQLRATEIMVLNSGAIGTPYLHWGIDIQLDDGQVGVYALRPRTVWDLFRMGANLLLGRGKGHPGMRHFDATQRIAIQADRPLQVQGDGEVIGHTPVEIQIVPGAVRVVVPPTSGDGGESGPPGQ